MQRKKECLLGVRVTGVGEKLPVAAQPSREGRQVAGNGEGLRNVSRRESLANGARRNAQTGVLVRERGRARKVVGAAESL